MKFNMPYLFAFVEGLSLIVIVPILLVLLVVSFVVISFFNTWLKAMLAKAPVGFLNIIAMKLRGVPYGLVVDARITAVKAGVELSTDDLESKDPRRIERGYNFETPINELSLGMEFNFFEFDLHDFDILFSPYIFSGISYVTFKEQLLLNGALNNTDKNQSTLAIPMVVGFKHRFYDNLILSVEIGARYTFSDKIDGNSVISDDLNYNFGNINNKDWYMFSNFSLTYTFGRNPCYCNIGQ